MPLIEPDTANPDGPFNLLLALAEWADVVVELNGVPARSIFILYNGRRRLSLGRDPLNDYFTGDPDQSSAGGAPTTCPALDAIPDPHHARG